MPDWASSRLPRYNSSGIQVISSVNLFRLYNAKVNVLRLNGSLRVCVPQTLCGCGEFSGLPETDLVTTSKGGKS